MLCSDVIPYFNDRGRNSEENLKLYILKDFNSFNLFKENYLMFWHFNDYLEKFKPINDSNDRYTATSLDFFTLVKDEHIDTDNVHWDQIADFLIKLNPYQKPNTLSEKKAKLPSDLVDAFGVFISDKDRIDRDNFNTSFQMFIENVVAPLPYMY